MKTAAAINYTAVILVLLPPDGDVDIDVSAQCAHTFDGEDAAASDKKP
jgi:hypothetical protein